MQLVLYAMEYAAASHGQQQRRYTGEPYITHPVRVAHGVSLYARHDVEYAIAAAILHDVIEDTDKTYEDMLPLFPRAVCDMVLALTDVPLSYGNRQQRKHANLIRILNAGETVVVIKACDMLDNLSSIVEHDKSFAHVFVKEYEQFLRVTKHYYSDTLAECMQSAYDKAMQSLYA